MKNGEFIFIDGETDHPFVATAIHAGHHVRQELKPLYNLQPKERLREEDPYTDYFASFSPRQIIGNHSRFEVDINRSRDTSVYRSPDEAWGLDVWSQWPGLDRLAYSYEIHRKFFESVREMLSRLIDRYGFVVIYDLHSYNFRRGGPFAPPDDPELNPDINLGTANLNRELWAPVIDGLIHDLQAFDFPGRTLDVRENIKFRGGYFSQWVREQFGDYSCAVAIEVKKFFMDEWTGRYDPKQLRAVRELIQSTVPGMFSRSRRVSRQLPGVLV